MSSLWRPGMGMEVERLENKLILFRFQHVIDIQRVLDNRPWHFDHSLLAVRVV
ncbi:hypothetical protein LINGRAHAP2_LOCUS4612 [Linum grandiflorum]